MQDTQTKLELASRGLLMTSKSDYPFDYFSVAEESLDADLIKKISGKTNNLIQSISLEYLFSNMMRVYPEASEQEKESAERYKNLLNILKVELNSLQVYLIGSVEVDVYIAGLSGEGIVEGLKTKLIET
ncbi:MAG: hypothetical protein H7Y07_13955 [Pyrinomonadaceae bacterium]|nr:hypothetical protein [Sphingobacteriaceae bacterium]